MIITGGPLRNLFTGCGANRGETARSCRHHAEATYVDLFEPVRKGLGLLVFGGFSLKCALARQGQPTNQPTKQSLMVSERTCLEEMASDLPGALFDGTGIEALDRVGDAGVQSLSSRC
jgi:hypothetical protein